MKRLALLAAVFLMSLVGMVGFSRAEEGSIQTVITELQNRRMAAQKLWEAVNTGIQPKYKMYYLTKDQVSGGEATAACSPGFHMANLFEIVDTSNLKYATGHPQAFSDIINFDDQRDGPSVLDFGWVRAGYASISDPSRDPYEGLNCENGISGADGNWGTVARLFDWATASQMNNEWQGVNARVCNQPYRVWCVENMESARFAQE